MENKDIKREALVEAYFNIVERAADYRGRQAKADTRYRLDLGQEDSTTEKLEFSSTLWAYKAEGIEGALDIIIRLIDKYK